MPVQVRKKVKCLREHNYRPWMETGSRD